MSDSPPFVIDSLQYCLWTREVFEHMREGGIDAVHATIGYHEGFRETVDNIIAWNTLFRDNADLITHARSVEDIAAARASSRTAFIFGLQNCSVLEGDLGLIQVCYDLGIRIMQISYNRQSLLACGCFEGKDSGLTKMGVDAIAEMNRTGIVVDLSHASEVACKDALGCSQRPMAITHAIPSFWHKTPRSISDEVMKELTKNGGMLGLSLYPFHLKGQSKCTREGFFTMVAQLAERIGVDNIGIGSDLCYGRANSALAWMRQGRWQTPQQRIEPEPSFPEPLSWFGDNRDFPTLREGLREAKFSETETAKIMGGNWQRFFEKAFAPSH